MSTGMIIAIARQYGSGGRKIGQQLAKDLNLPFYDTEQLAIAAKESDVNHNLFEDTDDKANSSLLYSLIMGSYTFGSHVEQSKDIPINDRLFLIQADLIKKAAQEGPCVFVERCADYVLRENKNVFSVFVHADQFSRMDRIVGEYGINPETAAEYLVKKDKQRANYYNFYTNKKWGDLENYHLAIDSSALGINNSVELIKETLAMLQPSN